MFALLAVWALLLQTAIPLVHTPPALAAGSDVPAWALATLCHVDAGDTAPADGQSRPGGQHAPDGAVPVCPICLGLHLAGTFTPPLLVALPLPSIAAASAAPRGRAGVLRPAHRSVTRARAPPAIA